MPGDTTANSGQVYVSLWHDIGLAKPEFRYYGATLVSQVNNGQVPLSRIDDLATRILASYYYLKQDSGYPRYAFCWST